MTSKSIVPVGTSGVYPWFPEHGLDLVHPEDRTALTRLIPSGKVFRCVGEEGNYLLLRHGTDTFRVRPSYYEVVPDPRFDVGITVVAQRSKGEAVGVVTSIDWHIKEARHIYFLSFDGKQSSRRYTEAELSMPRHDWLGSKAR